MSGRGIDHIGIVTDNLDGLVAQYEGLGFTLTPRAYHPDHMGTSNQLVQLAGRNFIELIEVDRPDGVAAPKPGRISFGHFAKDLLKRRAGMCLVVFRTQDRDADLAAWEARGLTTYEPFNFERLATLPDGTQQTVRFELGFVTSPDIPDVIFFVCHNRVEEHFWKPPYQTHANGAEEISAVVFASNDTSRDAAFFSQLFEGEITPRGCCLSVDCDTHRIDVVSAERLAEFGWTGDVSRGAEAAGLHIRTSGPARNRVAADQAGGAFIQWIE